MSCMATAPSTDDVIDQFLAQRGHETDAVGWDESYNKKQCPECGGLHETTATQCSVCEWSPARSS